MKDITKFMRFYGESIRVSEIDITKFICNKMDENTCIIDMYNENCIIKINDELIEIEMKYSYNKMGEFFQCKQSLLYDFDGVDVTYNEHTIAKALQELFKIYFQDLFLRFKY